LLPTTLNEPAKSAILLPPAMPLRPLEQFLQTFLRFLLQVVFQFFLLFFGFPLKRGFRGIFLSLRINLENRTRGHARYVLRETESYFDVFHLVDNLIGCLSTFKWVRHR